VIHGYYYLHVNGEMIYKLSFDGIEADFRESDLVRGFWKADPEDREAAWHMLVEASAAGARAYRIAELAEKWGCDDEDAQVYADHLGSVRLERDGDQWCAAIGDENIQDAPCGFGTSCLEALAELAKDLGYRPSKMWGATFADLCGSKPAQAKGDK
jgi:hypothetical protein